MSRAAIAEHPPVDLADDALLPDREPARRTGLLARLGERDRVLFGRWALTARPRSRLQHRAWLVITHCGGVSCSVSAAVLPLFLGGDVRRAAGRAAVGLTLSHVVVQIVKRCVSRRRPSYTLRHTTLVAEPPCFSFPSGHATAAMSVAFAYATAYPHLAAPLLAFAIAVGFSRIRLGVHYPGDVIAGQMIAIATDLVVRACW